MGIAAYNPCELIVRNGSEESTDKIFKNITGSEFPVDLEITRIGKGNRTPGHTLFFLKAVRHIYNQIKMNGTGAVITRSIGFLPYLFLLKIFLKVPVFFETHDFFGDLSLRTDIKKNLTVIKKSILEKIFLSRLDGIICLTETQAGFFKRYYPETPITIAKTGLFGVTKSERVKDGKTVCYSGSLDAHKGLGTVLQALSLTADKDIRLIVIGGKDEKEKNDLLSLASLLGAEGKVTVYGWVHHSDIKHLMGSSSAGIAPLRNTPFNAYFTSPLKILDYISHSLPVIASNLPSVSDYIEDGVHGILFEPENPESLALAMDTFFAGENIIKMEKAVGALGETLLWSKRGKIITDFINTGKLT